MLRRRPQHYSYEPPPEDPRNGDSYFLFFIGFVVVAVIGLLFAYFRFR